MSEKILMKGNEAFAEAAIRNGCRFYFGYPITPQNEITEYMSRELPLVGGSFIQAESELSAINMVVGASAAGGRAMISSSSPGIALMQEGFSVLCAMEAPAVAINVSRGGPGIGSIQPGQADYKQATRGGGNGDYHLIVFAPATIQEAVDMIGRAFQLSDEYRNPVMILADGMLGQMMEPVVLPPAMEALSEEDITRVKPWALTGHKNRRDRQVVSSLRLKQEELEENLNRIWQKYERAEGELPDYDSLSLSDAEVVFVAYGTTSRVTAEAVELLREKGVRAGLIRPKTLWPFPYQAFNGIGPEVKRVVSVELSKGQMMDDIRIGVQGRHPVDLISRVGGMLLSPSEVVERTLEILGVER